MKVDLANVRLRVDHQRRVAVEYDRGPKLSKWLAFTPYGLEKFEDPTSTFERLFHKALDKPLEAAALRLYESTRSAYLPFEGATAILLEIYIMTKTNGQAIDTLDLKGLVSLYNDLATAAGKSTVKNFKSKGEAIKRIDALKGEAAAPTELQTQHRTEKAEAAAKRDRKSVV